MINWGRFAQEADRSTWLWRGSVLLILAIVLVTGFRAGRAESSSIPLLATVSVTPTRTPKPAGTVQPLKLWRFVTPPPSRHEEPLSPASRNFPSVFSQALAITLTTTCRQPGLL